MLEEVWPRRGRLLARYQRWPQALGMVMIGTFLSRLLLPIGLVGVALWADRIGFGLLNIVESPAIFELGVAILLLDFTVWGQHWCLHKVSFFWRFHRVHHTDIDFDTFTALRFHPGELVLSLIWKGLVIIGLGAPAFAIIVFEIALSSVAIFNHSNLALPKRVDQIMRLFIVTPDMHRVHHSSDPSEGLHNYGFLIPWWDRLAGCYRAAPKQSHTLMEIGQSEWRAPEDNRFLNLLWQPLCQKIPNLPRRRSSLR